MIVIYLACVVIGIQLRVAIEDTASMIDLSKEDASSKTDSNALPPCTAATAVKPCTCRGATTGAINSTSATEPQECKVGETCVNGVCNDALQDVVPVVAQVECPKNSLLQAAPQYRVDPTYLKSDADGNCLCPPNHVCFSTEILDRMKELKKGLTGDPQAMATIDEMMQKQIFVIGCPARENDHVHWKTSRNKYSWRVGSAVCREIPPDEQSSEGTSEGLWMYVVLSGLVIMMLIILYISLRRGRPTTGPGPVHTGRSDDEPFGAGGRAPSPRTVQSPRATDLPARPSSPHKTTPR
eukprot:GEMP01026665.1.p1 GENE.GEMP01026665.1~~GEMP01026665.1.p1  ORF type:complete len:296 (+),score=50.08 GEMP01026665.1:839-1726(+)